LPETAAGIKGPIGSLAKATLRRYACERHEAPGGRMPRNDQVIRQWQILRQLEARRQGATLDELRAALPTDSPRHACTIRRDLEALEQVGFPIVNERVDGRVRWRLMDGFRHVPAMGFSPTELMALVISRALLKPLEGTHIQAALDSALKTLAAALPPVSHEYVQHFQGVFAVGLGPHKTCWHHWETINRLTQAIEPHRTVQVRDFSPSRGRLTRRELDPYRLWHASGGLYLVGYGHLRKEVRLFAVERLRSVTLTDRPYQVPRDQAPERRAAAHDAHRSPTRVSWWAGS